MAIIITLDQQSFVNMFADYGRADNFSIEARKALFDYYDDLSDDTGEDFQMDVIAICCDWHELSYQDALQEYDHLFNEDEIKEMGEDELNDHIRDTLNDETFVIELDDTLLIQAF